MAIGGFIRTTWSACAGSHLDRRKGHVLNLSAWLEIVRSYASLYYGDVIAVFFVGFVPSFGVWLPPSKIRENDYYLPSVGVAFLLFISWCISFFSGRCVLFSVGLVCGLLAGAIKWIVSRNADVPALPAE